MLLVVPACFARGSVRSIMEPHRYCWRDIQLRADS